MSFLHAGVIALKAWLERKQTARPQPVAIIEDAWLKQVAALPPGKQVEAVSARLKERNPGFDGTITQVKTDYGKVTEIRVSGQGLSDLSPVRALVALKVLNCDGSGMLSDLSPLKDLKLTRLNCKGTKVSDLSPLTGMPLTDLSCDSTKVFDLSPLKGMPLNVIGCDFRPERDAEILRSIKTLERINDKPVAEFWKEVDAPKENRKP